RTAGTDSIMDKKFYRSLLILVNDQDTMQRVHEYADTRISTLRDQLETTKSHDRILEIQGSIAELRRIRTLRDEVIKGAA
ncbi:MAG: hypothetical protein ACO20W_10855, partial [Anaerohalosphaeraceae bacterium]